MVTGLYEAPSLQETSNIPGIKHVSCFGPPFVTDQSTICLITVFPYSGIGFDFTAGTVLHRLIERFSSNTIPLTQEFISR